MMNVLLAEDENIIRRALVKQIDWNALGLYEPIQAASGEEAMELMQEHSIDLLVTDICMEEVSGIDLCRYAQECSPHTKCVIITGFGKLEYAKSAMKYGVAHFIMKPIDPDELIEALTECVQKIHAERESARKLIHLEESYRKTQILLKQQFLTELATGAIIDESYVEERIKEYGLGWDAYACCLIDSSECNGSAVVRSALCDHLQHDVDMMECFMADGQLYVLAPGIQPELYHKIRAIILESLTDGNALLGWSEEFDRLQHLPRACGEAVLALQIGNVQNDAGFLYCGEKLPEWNENPASSKMCNILNAIFAQKQTESLQLQTEDWLRSLSGMKIEALKSVAIEFMIRLQSIFNSESIPVPEKLKAAGVIVQISSTQSRSAILEILNRAITLAVQSLNQYRTPENSAVITRVREYIQHNIQKTITLEALSKAVYLSPKYISALVKRETGATLTEMLTTVRIDMAKKLLVDSHLKTYEIAERVGIRDARYFGQMFKAVTGMTPSVYRAQHRK